MELERLDRSETLHSDLSSRASGGNIRSASIPDQGKRSNLQCQLDTWLVYQMPDIEEGEQSTSPEESGKLQREAPFDQKSCDTLGSAIKALHLASQTEEQEIDSIDGAEDGD